MPESRRTLPLSPIETVNQRPTPRASSDGIPRSIESPHRPAAPPPANSVTAQLATTQFATGSGEHARPDAAQTVQFTAAVTKPMAANALDDDFGNHHADRTSTDLIATSAAILQCAPQHAIYDSYETSGAKFVDASTRLHAKQSPAAVATGVMRPNARVVFPALPAVQLASGTTPPSSAAVPSAPAPGRVGTLPPEARTAFVPSQDPSSTRAAASNPAARTVFEPQPILAAARPAATQFERPGVPRAKSPSDPISLRDEKSRTPLGRDSSADVQRAVQAALDKRRAFIAESFRDGRADRLASVATEEPTMLVQPEREQRTALLYMLLAVLTCVLAPVAWIHAEEQLMRSNALVFRLERAIGLALTLAAVAAIACGITVLLVR